MSTVYHLEGKKILVTGATSGIGHETVFQIVKMGGEVIITGRNQEKLAAIQENLGSKVIQSICCDFYEETDILNLATITCELDGLVHCAGMVQAYPIRYLTREKLQETFVLNFFSAVELVAKLDQKRKLKNKSSLIFISSISANHPHKGGTSYSSSKAALEAFMKVVAMEYSHKGIRSNSVSPAMVKTPLYENATEDIGQESMQAHIEKYPLGIGHVDDVANAIIYLLSDASKWVTGTNITLDGGCLLGY